MNNYDFINSKDVLQGEVLEKLVQYWKEKLQGLEGFELPADRSRPAVQTFKGLTYRMRLHKELSSRIKELARQEDVTLNMLLLAVFKVLLYRYTQQEDIAVGMPIANRSRVELEHLIGFLVNTLVIRTDLSGEPSFRTLLGRVKTTLLEAYDHQELPFEKLVEVLNPERDLSRNPLFQVMFVMAEAGIGITQIGEVEVKPVAVETGTSKFDLTMFVTDTEEGLEIAIEYSTDLFNADRIERMAGHYQRLLEEVVDHPEKKIWELELLSKAEKHQILVEWNDTAAEYPKDMCVHQLFEEQVTRTPEAVAVVFEDQQLTYRELNERANQLGHYLRKLGVGPEVLVAICVERSLEMIVGLLGILKAGGAYVPLDPSYPPERLKFMLADAQTPILLTQSTLETDLVNEHSHIVYLDQDWAEITKESPANVDSGVQPDNLVYVIYTSGSTGKPKGVMISQRNLVHSTSARLLYYSGKTERFLLLSSFAFDSSVAGIYGTLCQGGELHLISQENERDLLKLSFFIKKQHITDILLVPGFYKALLLTSQKGQLDSLKNVIVAGEECSGELISRHFEFLPNTKLYNEYGPTEGTVWSTVYKINSKNSYPRIPIGRAVSNVHTYILDKHCQVLPIGIPGELCIAGVGIAQGYLNCPKLAAEKFIPNPFTQASYSRLYRTGDLACWFPDGNIEFWGRIDHQVKIRGYRIELGEVEEILAQHTEVQHVVVHVHEDSLGEKHLIAYIVPHSKDSCDREKLRTHLKNKLPEPMIPRTFITLDTLPLTPNGKVNRAALPVPNRVGDHTIGTLTPACTETEKKLVKIWSQLLALDQVGINDDFFELGGNSLRAMQVIARMQEIFQVEISLSSLFRQPTVAAIATQIDVLRTQLETSHLSRLQTRRERKQ